MAAPRRVSPPSAAKPPPSLLGPVRVTGLGADGDGIAPGPGGASLFLAGTLPGELVEPGALTPRGRGWSGRATLLEPSPDRAVPPCPLFGPCGGCTIQHLSDPAYAAWKRGRVEDTLRQLGFTGELLPLGRSPPGSRRRMDLAIRREHAGAILVGLHAGRSADIVDMTVCHILHPALFALLGALRPVLRSLDGLKRDGSAVVNLLDTGPDLLLRTDAMLSSRDRQRLAGLGLARVAWALGKDEPELACQLRPATHSFAGHTTPVPPGAFLQASAEGEAAIRAAALAALPAMRGKARIVELYAGVGTLTHALAERGRVQAFEGDAAAIAALRAAGNPRVTPIARDLARQPLQLSELKGAAAIVLDPPYAGAAAQMPALAAAGLPIIYVSCNPAALLQDGRTLTAAGYRVTSAVAIDQFLWSARVEAVVAFRR